MIPTIDFAIVPVLATWLGTDAFVDLLHADFIGFIRRAGLMGYAGDGAGVSAFEIHPGPGRVFSWWQEAMFSAPAKALELQLANAPSSVRALEKNADLILARTASFEHSNQDFLEKIVHETYTDIMESPALSGMIAARTPHKTKAPIDLTLTPSNTVCSDASPWQRWGCQGPGGSCPSSR